MFYEDMVHEQENQTWFEVSNEMSGLPVKLSIYSSNDENYPDCIEIQHEDDFPIIISPRAAMQIHAWIDYHRERLIGNLRGEVLDVARQALEFSLMDTTFIDQLKKSSEGRSEELVDEVKTLARKWGVSEEVLDSLD